jgi:hypothetical protein
VPAKVISDYLGLHENTIYNLMKSINDGFVAIYNRPKNMIEKIQVRKEDLEKKISEIIRETKIQREIKHIMDSEIVQAFMKISSKDPKELATWKIL